MTTLQRSALVLYPPQWLLNQMIAIGSGARQLNG